MKKILFLLFVFVSVNLFSQTLNPPSDVVGSGYGVLKGETITVDNLTFLDNQVLLMQDNSILVIKNGITGIGRIEYGDVGDDVPKSGLVTVPRDYGGTTWNDYRNPTDVNPKVIIEKCVPKDFAITFGQHVDAQFTVQPDIAIANTGTLDILLGQSVTLTATAGDSYLWSNGATTQSITVSPTTTTIYTVTVNSGICSGNATATVNVTQPALAFANAGDDVVICTGTSTTLSAISTSPTAKFLWSNGATTQSITVSPTTRTVYTVTVSEIGSSDIDTVVVHVNQNCP